MPGWIGAVKSATAARGCVRNRCVDSELAKWLIDRHDRPESSTLILSTALVTVKIEGGQVVHTQKNRRGSSGSRAPAHSWREQSFPRPCQTGRVRATGLGGRAVAYGLGRRMTIGYVTRERSGASFEWLDPALGLSKFQVRLCNDCRRR